MDFFEKLTETFAKNSKEFADKAKDYAEVAKLHTKINAANTKINESLITLGKAYYDAHKNDGNTEFEAIFEEIHKAHLTIRKCQEEIQKIKNIKICEKCGEEVSADATYCSHCGAKLKTTDKKEKSDDVVEEAEVNQAQETKASDLEEEAEKKTVICPSCGQELDADAEFCTKCGSSMK
ncbi:MAG TPA: zinc-ribbon domain-containing protein [Candidatus Fimimorpha faecalis]|uniref:Zinc-ribbon domain-containing protein n=1 Tax=Candidatus Fimimorpha faecalis TaxID=2840824 RepID=A0A9D1EDZ6_9FIRM|nr:zinc-ribbon domain-containing protein [Candidatus Fimimorpha faecalis]